MNRRNFLKTILATSLAATLPVTAKPIPERITYIGNGSSQTIVTGIISHDMNWTPNKEYYVGDTVFIRDEFSLYQCKIGNCSNTFKSIYWDKVDV